MASQSMLPPAQLLSVIVSVWGAETQKPATAPTQGAGVATVIAGVLALATSLAGIVAVRDVLPPKLVVRALPLTRTTDVGTKFWPVAVRVKLGPPAPVLVGVIELSTGAEGGAVTARS